MAGALHGEGGRWSSFDRCRPGRSRSFYDVKLVSPERRRGELVRSLGADEIKRDDLAIHASGGVTHSVRVHFFGAERVEQYSVEL